MSDKRRLIADGTPEGLPLEIGHWLPDHDDDDSVDDMFVRNCDVHLERMSNGYYWLGIYVDRDPTKTVHVELTSKRRIKAWVRR